MIWLLVRAAAACSPASPTVELLAPPRADLGVWLRGVSASPDLALEIDGALVDGALVEHPDPGGFGNFALFLPDVPLAEGQGWRLTTLPGTDRSEVREGTVGPRIAPEVPALEDVEVGAVREDVPCRGSGPYREIELALSEGEGLVLLEDESAGEPVRAAFVDGRPLRTSFLRDGGSAEGACLTATAVLADGAEVPLDTVCSANAGCGCRTGAPTGAGLLPLLAGLVRRRVRGTRGR